jgi:hypothetical protein
VKHILAKNILAVVFLHAPSTRVSLPDERPYFHEEHRSELAVSGVLLGEPSIVCVLALEVHIPDGVFVSYEIFVSLAYRFPLTFCCSSVCVFVLVLFKRLYVGEETLMMEVIR